MYMAPCVISRYDYPHSQAPPQHIVCNVRKTGKEPERFDHVPQDMV